MIDLRNVHERELYPFLITYLNEKMKIGTKTISHEKSAKAEKGMNEWLHPDVVGFNLPGQNLNEKIFELCGNFFIDRAVLYSFELKKSITLENLREYFFQAVSNSSWANEGYLVGVNIDTTNDNLMSEMYRLSRAFNIGIIKLNLKDVYSSEILFSAKRKNRPDEETMNKLFEINDDFKSFIEWVLNSIKINKILVDKNSSENNIDKVLSVRELAEILNELEEKENNINENETFYDEVRCLNINSTFTSTTPIHIELEGNIEYVNSWKDTLIKVCNYFIEKDKDKFRAISRGIKGKKPYFSRNSNDLRIAYPLEDDLFVEINSNANTVAFIIRRIVEAFEIPEESIKFYVR